ENTSPSRPLSSTTRPAEVGSAGRVSAVPEDTVGILRSWICSWLGSLGPSTHAPSGVIPIGSTSNLAGSRLPSTLAADTQETACSELRPPKTTATLSLSAAIAPDPTRAADSPGPGGIAPARPGNRRHSPAPRRTSVAARSGGGPGRPAADPGGGPRRAA